MREILLLQRRVLKRLDLTARSLFALIEPGSAFAGSLLELALAADRSYMLADDGQRARPVAGERRAPADGHGPVAPRDALLRARGARPAVLAHDGAFGPADAVEAGLVTFAPDEIDWDDELRLAIEERARRRPTR